MAKRIERIEAHLEAATHQHGKIVVWTGQMVSCLCMFWICAVVVVGAPFSCIALYAFTGLLSNLLTALSGIVNFIAISIAVLIHTEWVAIRPILVGVAVHGCCYAFMTLVLDCMAGVDKQRKRHLCAKALLPFGVEASSIQGDDGTEDPLIILVSILPAMMVTFFIYYFGVKEIQPLLECPPGCAQTSCCSVDTSYHFELQEFVTYLAGNLATAWAIIKLAGTAYIAYIDSTGRVEGSGFRRTLSLSNIVKQSNAVRQGDHE